jgi:hypothetical protein
VLTSGGDLQVYLATFMQKSGISDNTGFAHDLRNLIEILRLMISHDQLDPTNFAATELIPRRILEIQVAVKSNPTHPNFSRIDVGTRGSMDEVGAVHAEDYTE